MGARAECNGLWGKLLGHQFIKRKGGYVYSFNSEGYCFRCGMPAGGWPK